MATEIELYKGEQLEYFGRVSLASVLRLVFAPILNDHDDDARFLLEMRAIADTTPIAGKPRLVNLRSALGYADVTVVVGQRLVYRHPHRVGELIGPALQRVAENLDPEATDWGFCVSSESIDDYPLERPVPAVECAVDLDITAPRRQSFHIHKLPEPPPMIIEPRALGIDSGLLGPVNVLVAREVAALLDDELRFSQEVEEGGFLSGRVHRAPTSKDRYVVEIAGVSPAQHSGASLMHFTFTGDSFGAMHRLLASERPDEQLVGWYHTHLFAASEEMGLSSIDDDLHFGTFQQPWQVAGLVNIADGKRVLRFYARQGDEMQECPYWVANERGRYGAPSSRVGAG